MTNPTIEWKNRTWLMQETWGRIHPDKPWFWYDPEQVQIVNGNLELLTGYNPKFFRNLGWVKIGAGLVCCLDQFHFGDYKIVVKLPKGKYLWPAIWLWGQESWPPEIDIMEGYTNSRGSYFHWNWPPYKIQSNFHFKQGIKNTTLGSQNIYIGLANPSSRYITFEMVWGRSYIKIYANGWLHRTITGSDMKYFQKPMRFILNNGTQKPLNNSNSKFIIKDFQYYE
jgi:hypothetical protein